MQLIYPQQKLIVSLVAATLATLAFPAFAAPPSAAGQSEYARGRILVEARPGLSNDDLDTILKVHGGKRRKLGQSNVHIVDLPGNASETAVIERLRHNPHLKFAELDKRVAVTMSTNDPYAGSAWHLSKIGADTAWDVSQGAGVTVAILDSGVDTTHPDLAPNLVAGFNVYDNNTDVADVCGHGTAVAGTAAAATNNGVGVAGMAGSAKIMPIRIAFFDASVGKCYAYYSTAASGLTYAADHGARVANISYGSLTESAAVASAADYLKSKGGLVFVSAGNTGTDQAASVTNSMIVVSATDGSDAKAGFSSFGAFVHLSAPGTGIWTTSRGGAYQAWSGTSFSSPLAAGVAAVMMAANPSLDGAKIEQLLYSTSVDLGAAGRDPLFGFGRVDAGAAVRAAAAMVVVADTQAPSVAINAPLGSSSVSGLVAVQANALDNVGVARVDLTVNGTTVASNASAPYDFSWNSAGVANGMANLVAVAYDAAGNKGQSATVAVNVANAVAPVVADTVAPAVTINNPVGGAVSGTVSINVSASDNSGAAGITQTLYIDGKQVAKGSGGAMSYNWNSRKVNAGTHSIYTVATDRAGNSRTASVSVTTR
ncbi:S8 family serine peptidase [Massilia sp. TWR1-2-2]|uniref:S8 family serine peptidase n=1 Tax=Massilia sp. TWR1-2-2 TaxID=2804584 RepID=UPI003CF3FEA5